jgi:hypothetical protein
MEANAFRSRLVAAALGGLALRCAWWWYARPEPVSDFEWLRRLAEGLIDHHQYGYPRLEGGKPPAYPFLLAGLMLISRSTAWLSFVTVLIAAALVPLVGVLGKRLGLGTSAAIGSAWICAANPTFVFFAPVLATEHLFSVMLLVALIVLLGTNAATGSRRGNIAGALFGVATLARVDALFYLPVFAAVIWIRPLPRRVRSIVALVLVAGMVLTPWYLRNRTVIGAGAGLSTAGGATFYHAHHDGPYGWRPLTGTPLEGVHQLELHRRGYELGLEYIRRVGVVGVLHDMLIATGQHYSPLGSPYAVRFSTSQAGPNPDQFTEKPVAGALALGWVNQAIYGLLLVAALGSLFFARRLPGVALVVLYGFVVMNWLAHCWIYLGGGRYRYVAEVAFCILAAVTIMSLRNRKSARLAGSQR